MDPKVLMQLTQLIQELPPDKLSRMQTLMHNMMAGFDVRKDMEELERSLPPGFRERLGSLVAGQAGMFGGMAASGPSPVISQEPEMALNLREARLTILRAVAEGQVSPEEAEKLLFNT